jgi:Leucine-rich repeat (LRR) protein
MTFKRLSDIQLGTDYLIVLEGCITALNVFKCRLINILCLAKIATLANVPHSEKSILQVGEYD